MVKALEQIRSFYEALRAHFSEWAAPELPDRLSAITACVLAGDGSLEQGAEDLLTLLSAFTDLNEIRIARTSELSLPLGGKMLDGPVWERCRAAQDVLNDLFRKIGNLDIDSELKDAKPAEIRKFIGSLESLNRETSILIRMHVFAETEAREIIADKVVSATCQAAGLITKGMTRHDFVKQVKKALSPEEGYELYLLLRRLRDACRDPETREFDSDLVLPYLEEQVGWTIAPARSSKSGKSKKAGKSKTGARKSSAKKTGKSRKSTRKSPAGKKKKSAKK